MQLPAAITRRFDGLRRQAEVDGLAAQRRPLAQLPQLGQRGNRRVRGTGVEGGLHLHVLQAGHRPDQRRIQIPRHRLTLRIEDDVPDERRTDLVRKQAARPLGQARRMQAGRLVRQVNGLAAPHRLLRDAGVRLNQAADVGDGVQDAEGGAIRGTLPHDLQEHGLVQVHGAGRVDGHEGHVRQVAPRRPQIPHGRRLLVQLQRELLRHPELAGNGTEIQRGGVKLHDASLVARVTRAPGPGPSESTGASTRPPPRIPPPPSRKRPCEPIACDVIYTVAPAPPGPRPVPPGAAHRPHRRRRNPR